ncbi:DgyrCDS4110 [Dimorphilus gyrociliatus]|uniref:ABC-type glutathione-S-conjugate transporter n=1 Tax=Dimorphilus gyrociliatus TaxID=2664684 RepID=A0A7I8VFY9_9ANNE|nr:DgyrCDS4110 [Dimorphilus gyrociliatus]
MISNTTSFTKFCGGEPFWNLSLTWYTSNPDLTECFQQSALVWGPCGFLWLTLLFYIRALRRYRTNPTPINKLNTLKTINGIILTFICFITFLKAIVDKSNGKLEAEIFIVSPLIQTVTFIVSTILVQIERRKGFIKSGIQWIFFLLSFIAGVVIFASKVQHAVNDEVQDKFRFVIFFVYFGFLFIQFILFSLADLARTIIPAGKKVSPETEASFPSYLTFWWMNRLIITGYKKTLEEDDLFELHPRDQSKNVAPVFKKAWASELRRCNWAEELREKARNRLNTGMTDSSYGAIRSDKSSPFTTGGDEDNERTRLLPSRSTSEVHIKKPKKEPSLFKVMVKTYGFQLFKAHICKFICDLLLFLGPILQKQLIGFSKDDGAPNWKGYVFAASFFLYTIVYSVFFHQLFHIGMTLGMRIKSAFIAAVYKKALTMSNEARKTSTVGEIVNLMSVDAQRMQDVTGYLWMIWSCPVQIALAMYMLWNIVGYATLAGLGVMILLIPVNAVLASFQRKFQISQMTQKDQRIKLMNEVLNGMKVLKLYAWELSFKEKVNVIRNLELETLRKFSYLSAFGTFTWTCAPFIVTLATFSTYVLSGHGLTSEKAFVSLSLFNILRFPINLLPMMVTYIVTASVSLKRLGTFLKSSDLDETNVQHDPAAPHPIQISNGTFAWGTDENDHPILKNINLKVDDGKLIAVVGQVGSGKSSLISAVLGEMIKLEGKVNVRGNLAYVAQQAWIQNKSLKDNILFGKQCNDLRYDRIIDACALRPDLDILPGGDQTEIGEKGINLSGGQKQRVSLARAVYNDADVYLFDDPLSAVDSHVGKHIFEQVIGPEGLLKTKTRVLVTHGVQWLPYVDKIVVLLNGVISEMGSYEELLSHDGAFAQFLKTYLQQETDEDEEEVPELQEIKARLESVSDDKIATVGSVGSSNDSTHVGSYQRQTSGTDGVNPKKLVRKFSRVSSVEEKEQLEEEMKKKMKEKEAEKLIQEEKSEVGKVKLSVFIAYLKSMGAACSFGLFFFFCLYQLASVFANIWLSWWTDDERLAGPTNNTNSTNGTDIVALEEYYLGIYGALGGGQAFFVLIYAIITAISVVNASTVLHEGMLFNVLRSPMSFFDTTPIGRILNRFSRDIETIDNILPGIIRSWMNTMFTVISTVIVISYSTPIFLSVVLPLGLLYYFIQRFYIPTSRQLKRIESTTRSPIYVHFSETITGASTIRAYGVQSSFIKENDDKVDHNLKFYFSSIASNRWLGYRLEFVGACIVFSAALFAVIGKKDHIAGGIVGLSISYALQITQSLNWMVRMNSDIETNIVSVERVKEYSETPAEAEWNIDRTRPPREWPQSGRVSFDNYSVRYRPGLDLVLRGISCQINGGEKIGIVGRTGAGKSSLTLCLFRILEAAGGKIVIDDVEVDSLGLHQLRSRLTILPQDPVLFSGSLRMNLDPFSKYTDEQVWHALEHAHLKDFVNGLALGLDYECGEGGQNLSVGQRQLVCLARSLLRKTKILVLDEATAAVDLETDELIQKTIRSEFASCTILTIAHRLNTIMDYDKVVVMDKGQIIEFNSPNSLLKNKNSVFYSMAKDANLV